MHDGQSVIPNYAFAFAGNIKLACPGNVELKSKPIHEAPMDRLYMLPPVKNALKELCESAQIDFKIYGKQTVRVLWPASLLRLRPSAPRLTTRTRLATRASST